MDDGIEGGMRGREESKLGMVISCSREIRGEEEIPELELYRKVA